MISESFKEVSFNNWIEYHTTEKYRTTANKEILTDYYAKRWYEAGELACGPIRTIINITNRCNLNCNHCSKKESFDGQDINLSDYFFILEKITTAGVHNVSLTGGEPLLHPQILKILEKTKKANCQIDILTNLISDQQMVEDVAERLDPLSDTFQVSIDDIGNDYETIRRGANFYVLDNNLDILVRNGFCIKANMVITKKNVANMSKVFTYCHDKGIGRIRFTPYFGKDNLKIIPDDEILFEMFNKVLEIWNEKNSDISIDADPIPLLYPHFSKYEKLSKMTDYFSCPACVTSMEADIHGNVYPCSYLNKSDFYGGNLLDDSVEKIWNSEVFNAFRNYIAKDKCTNCSQQKYCRGGCKANIIVNNGRLSGVDNYCRR